MKNYIIFLVLLAGFAGVVAAQKFDFGPGASAKGFTPVRAADVYSPEKGFGFEPGAAVECFDRRRKNALQTDFCTSQKPFYFSVAVPEGNYRVRVTFGDYEAATATTVKAELRRLMLERIETKPGKFVTE